jgi:membrane protease YdiL (CAAX protease family)
VKNGLPPPVGFWMTVRLLLSASRKRADGRQNRQSDLLRNRTGTNSVNWGGLAVALTAVLMIGLNIGVADVAFSVVKAGERLDAERQGKVVVSAQFKSTIRNIENSASGTASRSTELKLVLEQYYRAEARRIARDSGETAEVIEKKIRDAIQKDEASSLVDETELTALRVEGPVSAMFGSIVLLLWGAMLVFQGEGLELDIHRRRHPMWEWLFSHPVPPGAIFLAEMLSPVAANSIYWSAPLFVGFLYGFLHGFGPGALAALLIGVPVSVAAACLGKALEIGVILRFSARTRGAIVGLMTWLGYASMMVITLGILMEARTMEAIGRMLAPLGALPWPWLGLFLGARPDGSFSFLLGAFTCWAAAGVMIAGSVWFSVWGARQGLGGNIGQSDLAPAASCDRGISFGKEPLYRKELLWFLRDRSAIVQAILVPLTAAAFQLFNFRGLLSEATAEWNYLCGTGILLGTYFLWVLGPKSLASEGPALWIALTWPRGLENLLKVKAWLWSLVASGIVALVLCCAAFLFPASGWKIALVGAGWFFFGRSMAERTVTLVSVTSSSGEPEKVPMGRRWATQLGMLTFSIGVLTEQWHIAIMGIVYSMMTAAAVWENFRARLPYLYDPWSEKLPPPPTLMHAMIAISGLVESGAIVTSLAVIFAGRENIAIVQAVVYALCAVAVSMWVSSFLSARGVPPGQVWCWAGTERPDEQAKPWWRWDAMRAGRLALSLALGAAGGLLLGAFAHGYLAALQQIPFTAEILEASRKQMAKVPHLWESYAVMAVAFAPLAEEYLFRGLLFRALDRNLGGWRAVLGSAAFFAVYHPPIAWLPVAFVGVANALVFKNTGRLAPAVVLHMVYNAVVLA